MANTSIGSIPAEANSKGGINPTTPPEQRTSAGAQPKTEGPQKDAKTGAYAPAEYPVTRTMVDAKGNEVTRTSIRRDR